MAIHYMTQEGLDKLKKDLADAVAQRPVISAQIAEARDKGDLSENAEYEAAREAQGLLELNIAKLQDLVANARVIDESQIGTEKVQMLNKVKVKNLSNGMVMEFTLVGESEADFAHGRLAATTPIGKALMGHSKGETVEVHVPSGVIKFEILDISLFLMRRHIPACGISPARWPSPLRMLSLARGSVWPCSGWRCRIPISILSLSRARLIWISKRASWSCLPMRWLPLQHQS